MKKIILLCICSVLTMAAWSKTHTVQRGETIESIAQIYNISTAQLLEANPSAKELFYVGLKLDIPEATATTSVNTSESSNQVETVVESAPKTTAGSILTGVNASAPEDSKPITPEGQRWSCALQISYGFLEKPEGYKSVTHNTFSYELSGVYWATKMNKGIFASLGLGYKSMTQSYSKEIEKNYSVTISTNYSLITIPLKLGYAICDESGSFGLSPYLGFDLGISVKGKSETEYRSEKRKEKLKTGKLAPDFRLGLMFRIYLNIGVSYTFPLSKDSKTIYGEDGYPEISFGWGF